MFCIVQLLASSPVTVTAYKLLGKEDPNVIVEDVNGVPPNEAAEADPPFIVGTYDAVAAYEALEIELDPKGPHTLEAVTNEAVAAVKDDVAA